MQVLVEFKTVYGQQLIYPACEKSRLFAAMANQKTLTQREVDLIKRLGYTVNVTHSVPSTL